MKISEIKPGRILDVKGTISALGEIQKTPQGLPNREGILSDDEDQIKLVLWEGQTEQFQNGDKIHITAGFCKCFPRDDPSSLQVSTGKFGKIVKL
jgi:hypothetical protein